jgi:hypothetical protein
LKRERPEGRTSSRVIFGGADIIQKCLPTYWEASNSDFHSTGRLGEVPKIWNQVVAVQQTPDSPGVLRGVETKKMALNKYLSKEKKLAFVEAI